MTGNNINSSIWLTKVVDIRFPSNFNNINPNAKNDQAWIDELDGWVMEMEMNDNGQRKPQNIIMKCLAIENTSFKLNSSEHRSIGR